MTTKLLQTFFCGTAIKITSILNIDTATTVRISITDPSSIVLVNNADMTKAANKIYTYILQTASTWTEGDYIVTIDVTYSGYQAVTQQKFTLIEQEP